MKNFNLLIQISAIFLCIVFLRSSYGVQIIYLKDGSIINGKIIGYKNGKLFVEQKKEKREIKKSYISWINYLNSSDIIPQTEIFQPKTNIKSSKTGKPITSHPGSILVRIKESWYTYWGLGTGWLWYPEKKQKTIDSIKKNKNIDNTRLSEDIFGLYFPYPKISEKILLGFIINANSDNFERTHKWLHLYFLTYSASLMYFIKSVGNGFFVRLDLGPANGISYKYKSFRSSNIGLGSLLGMGVSIPIAGGTSIIISLTVSNRLIESSNYQALNISLGGLF